MMASSTTSRSSGTVGGEPVCRRGPVGRAGTGQAWLARRTTAGLTSAGGRRRHAELLHRPGRRRAHLQAGPHGRRREDDLHGPRRPGCDGVRGTVGGRRRQGESMRSGWGHDGTLNTGSGDTANKTMPGQVGNYALKLDGVNDGVAIDNFGVFTTTTVSAWVYRTGAHDCAARRSSPTRKTQNCGLVLALESQSPIFYVHAKGTWYHIHDTTGEVPLNEWVHFAVVQTPTTCASSVTENRSRAGIGRPSRPRWSQCTGRTGYRRPQLARPALVPRRRRRRALLRPGAERERDRRPLQCGLAYDHAERQWRDRGQRDLEHEASRRQRLGSKAPIVWTCAGQTPTVTPRPSASPAPVAG